jgi:hypothetical protein
MALQYLTNETNHAGKRQKGKKHTGKGRTGKGHNQLLVTQERGITKKGI